MNNMIEYRSKLRTAEEAVRLVKNGDWVDYGSNNGYPPTLDAALAARRDELFHVKVRGNLLRGPLAVVECDPSQEHFVYNTWHCSSYERKLCDAGRAFFTPMLFRDLDRYYLQYLTVDVAMLSVAPMDENGCFNLSGALGAETGIVEVAKKIIVEVNENLPRIRGGAETSIPLERVDAIVEAGKLPLWEMKSPEPSEIDRQIANHVLPLIPDGAVIQLGIGGMPNALGELLAESDLKDLGMHTELCSDGYLALFKAGKLTNAQKTLHPGKGVLGLAIGSQELFDWIHENDAIMGAALSYVNNPWVIAQNEKMISINGCLNVDLYGQVASESAGTRQISGTGGQLDFVTGASMSKGGRAFLCLPSTFTDKKGVLHSRILPQMGGDIITTPRSQAPTIVTEFGAADLTGRSTWERAERLIGIAHPDFREELIRHAEEQRIWLPSNKRYAMVIDEKLYRGRPEGERIHKEMRCYDLLDGLGIEYFRVDHEHADTIPDCELVEELLGCRICKNLFLTNRQQTDFYLLIMPGEKPFKTKLLSKQIGSARLSFAGPEHMERLLDITPGSVSVLGLMNDAGKTVRLLVDRDLLKEDNFGCHPCINTSSLRFKTRDLFEKILPALEHEPTFVELPWEIEE